MKAKPTRQPGRVLFEVNRRDESLMRAATSPSLRLKQILVPIDFSECSKKALQYAAPLAEQHDAAITLIYVLPPPTFGAGDYVADYSYLEAEMRANAEKQLRTLLEGELGGQLEKDAVTRIGRPASEIIDLAKSLPADLIVISTHGHTGLKHILLGSVAEEIVRRAPCPVLVVREREHEFVRD
jgi:universal stress protein A